MTNNTGGPAFPEGKGVGDVWMSEGGMTLRDAIAMSVHMPEELSLDWAEALIGEQHPRQAESELTRVDWWMRVEAAYRYRQADAMIKERSK